ncbi:hypothetical protein [Rubrivirga sp.]|uniref:hypothetical protein n=1 Tax=Rubrivirga sp. TaxID=1885344 RepID=UPI003C75EF1A
MRAGVRVESREIVASAALEAARRHALEDDPFIEPYEEGDLEGEGATPKTTELV